MCSHKETVTTLSCLSLTISRLNLIKPLLQDLENVGMIPSPFSKACVHRCVSCFAYKHSTVCAHTSGVFAEPQKPRTEACSFNIKMPCLTCTRKT